MTAEDASLTGSCRCGRTRIELSAAPFMTSACHCTGCQKMSASAFSLTAMFPAEALRVTAGEPVKGGVQGPRLDHYFCPDCKTWMFTRIEGRDFVNVRPTMLDDTRWSEPFIETMTAEKLPWAQTPARYSFPGFPAAEDYDRLVKEFAASR